MHGRHATIAYELQIAAGHANMLVAGRFALKPDFTANFEGQAVSQGMHDAAATASIAHAPSWTIDPRQALPLFRSAGAAAR